MGGGWGGGVGEGVGGEGVGGGRVGGYGGGKGGFRDGKWEIRGSGATPNHNLSRGYLSKVVASAPHTGAGRSWFHSESHWAPGLISEKGHQLLGDLVI